MIIKQDNIFIYLYIYLSQIACNALEIPYCADICLRFQKVFYSWSESNN